MSNTGTPQVGERWRWSYCEGPDWCCGGEGVITKITTFDGEPCYEVKTDDATGWDAFQINDDLLRVEKIT